MRGRSRVRRDHFGLETAGRNARPPSPCQTPRRCRLSHGNMDIHIPSVCLQVLSYRDRPRLHSLVHSCRLRLGSRCVPVRFAFFGGARWWFHCCVFRAYLVEVFCSCLQFVTLVHHWAGFFLCLWPFVGGCGSGRLHRDAAVVGRVRGPLRWSLSGPRP